MRPRKTSLKKQFEKLNGDVELIVFMQEFECSFCEEARGLVLEIGTLSPKISTKVYDLVKEEELAKKYNIKKIPATAIIGKSDYGIRYYGVPAGYELPIIVDDIIDISRGSTMLSDNVKKKLAEINKPVGHIGATINRRLERCIGKIYIF
jgi:alkyl hydroperoxide reductase subunit AhpF